MAQYAQTTSDYMSPGTPCAPKWPGGTAKLHSVTWVQTGCEFRIDPNVYHSTYRVQEAVGVWVWTWEIS